MRTNAATTAYMALLGLFCLATLFQPFSAGLGIFGDGFEAHEIGGGVVHVVAGLAFLAALISPTRRTDAPLAFLLLVLVTVQITLVTLDDASAAVRALHPFLAVTNLLFGLWLHLRAQRTVRAGRAPRAPLAADAAAPPRERAAV